LGVPAGRKVSVVLGVFTTLMKRGGNITMAATKTAVLTRKKEVKVGKGVVTRRGWLKKKHSWKKRRSKFRLKQQSFFKGGRKYTDEKKGGWRSRKRGVWENRRNLTGGEGRRGAFTGRVHEVERAHDGKLGIRI